MFKTGTNGIAIKNRQLNSTGPKKLTLTKDNSFLVFPFELVAGYITSTENGLRQNDNVNIEDYSNFQRVFTGLENMLAKWDGAYKVEKKNDADTFLTKEYSVGRNIRAFIPNEKLGASFETTSISSDFLAEFTDEEFTLHAYEDIEEKDLFKLFIIPELRQQKWLFISNAERFFHNGVFHHVEITMTTLNNKVAKSGRAIEEFIQRGAPGEGYAWPLVNKDQTVILDEIRTRDVPITSIQIEMAGPGAFNTVVAYGRPTIQKTNNGITESVFNPKIEAPRLLFPLRVETAIPSPENTRPSAETDYYWGQFQPTLQTQYKDWRGQFQGSYDLEQRNKYQGVLIGKAPLAELRKSNPVDDKGTHTHTLWDQSWKIAIQKKYDTTPNIMTGDELVINDVLKINEIMTHNFFATSHLSALPLTVQQNVGWGIKDLPIVGGFLSKLTLGVPIGWNNTAVRLKMESVDLLMPSSLAEYGNVLKGDGTPSDSVWIPLETFTAERSDEAIDNSGINATGTIFKASLTHRFTKTINGVDYTFDSIDLNQNHPTVDDEGTIIVFAGQTPDKLLWDGTCKPTGRGTVPGYVIDMPHFKTLAKLDYRLSFFNFSDSVWAGTYQTQAKFTGSIRDWVNTIKMSNWKEDNDKEVSYPAYIVAPKPPTVNYPVVDLKALTPSMLVSQEFYFEELKKQGMLDTFGQPIDRVANQLEFIIEDPVGTPKVAKYENIALKYDLVKHIGSVNELKNNYKSIQFTLNVNNNNNVVGVPDSNYFNFNIDTNELITQGSITHDLGTYEASISWLASQFERITTKAGKQDRIILYYEVKNSVKVEIVGDELQITGIMEITIKSITDFPFVVDQGKLKAGGSIFGRLDLTDVSGYRYNTRIQVDKMLLDPKEIP